jgi:hypothetical protein
LTAALQFAEKLFVRAARSALKPAPKKRTLIAAVNHGATRKQALNRVFHQTVWPPRSLNGNCQAPHSRQTAP